MSDHDVEGIGLQKARDCGLGDRFTFLEERSLDALPRLASVGLRADFVFIDGGHEFDSVMLDVRLPAMLCAPEATAAPGTTT